MKNIYGFSLLLLTVTLICPYKSYAQSGWISQSPPPVTFNAINKVHAFDSKNIIAVGNSGLILRTEDGGVTWRKINTGTTSDLKNMYFLDNQTGWAVGGSMLKTQDGGYTWTIVNNSISTTINAVCFIDNTTGWGTFGSTVRKTTDGGLTWTTRFTGSYTTELEDIQFVDDNIGMAVGIGDGQVYRTTNGGVSWATINLGIGWIKGIQFVDTVHAWASGFTCTSMYYDVFNGWSFSGMHAAVWRTNDAGSTWNKISFTNTTRLYDIYCIDTNTVVTVGGSGLILKSNNSGSTWINQTASTTNDIYGISFVNADTVTVVGNNGTLLRTVTGGVNWYSQNDVAKSNLNSSWFMDQQTGWVVGNLGTIQKTSDGGTTWIKQTSSSTKNLHSVVFTNANIGTAVGDSGAILRTTDGGTIWTSQNSGTLYNLGGISFTDVNTGTAVGSGIILRTTNGGATWTSQNNGTWYGLNGVSFIDASTGIAVGYNGTILRTTNGGTTWTKQSSGTTNNLNGIFFIDANTGTVVGENGVILRTTNGGASWTSQISGTTFGLYGVSFIDANNGTAVGGGISYETYPSQNYCIILHTTNGGATWGMQVSPTSYKLNSVYVVNNDIGWTVGDYGIIFKTISSGGTAYYPSSLVSPLNGTVRLPKDPTLIWNSIGNAISYRLQVATDSKFYNKVVDNSNITGTQYQLQELMVGTKYYWRVVAKTVDNLLLYSATYSFSTLCGWKPQSSGTTNHLLAVSFIDATTATAVGSSGTILHTTDGGVTWTSQNSGTLYWLTGVSFTDANTGTAVGSHGTILRTEDGGSTWTSQSSGTTNELYGVTFIDANTGMAVGSAGTILRTTDGGFTWTSQNNEASNLNGVSFTDANTGTVVGPKKILRTTNGGVTWTSQNNETISYLNGVSFTDANTGTAVGYTGTILRTTNGGTTWQSQSSSTTNDLFAVTFTDANIGTVVGNNGTIRHTTNGGTTWDLQSSGTTNILKGISFTDENSGIVVGRNGTILWTLDGGGDALPILLPGIPALGGPSNGAINQALAFVFWWNNIDVAESYRLQISTSSSFTTLVIDDSAITRSSKYIYGLNDSTKYYWRVSAKNSIGSSPWSEIWNFTTILIYPTVPILVAPKNDTLNQALILNFSWNNVAGAVSYRLQVSNSSDFTTLFFDDSTLTTTSNQVSGLKNSTKYYWRVSAKNSTGLSPWSETWNFTTLLASPNAPTLTAPKNDTLNQPLALYLSWNSIPGVVNYRLQVSTSSSFTMILFDDSTLTTTSKQIRGLIIGTKYFWRVRAKNIVGSGPWSDTWNFTTSNSSAVEIAYDNTEPVGVFPLSKGDTVIVRFDGMPGMKLDSIRVALRNTTPIEGGIWKAGTSTFIGQRLAGPFFVAGELTPPSPYPVPWPNWVTVDLRSNNIDASTAFIAAFVIDGVYANSSSPTNRVMHTTSMGTSAYHSYTYLGPLDQRSPGWYYLADSTTLYLYLIRAYLSPKGTVVENSVEVIPTSHTLSQNYPNPFNPSTTISFSLPSKSFVLLKVFDLIGREVATIVSEELSAGNYSRQWIAANMPSGVYFYRLSAVPTARRDLVPIKDRNGQAGAFTETKKLILLR